MFITRGKKPKLALGKMITLQIHIMYPYSFFTPTLDLAHVLGINI